MAKNKKRFTVRKLAFSLAFLLTVNLFSLNVYAEEVEAENKVEAEQPVMVVRHLRQGTQPESYYLESYLSLVSSF